MTNEDSTWSFEGPDPEVGIFGDLVVHETCPTPVDEDSEPSDELASQTTSVDADIVRVTRVWRCNGCGELFSLFEDYPRSHFELPDDVRDGWE